VKNLALAFCSLRPVQLSKEVCDAREDEYLICLKQLKRVLPDSFDLLVCENTIDKPDQLQNTELKELLSDTEMCAVGSEGNIGTRNKGMGELLMLKTALDQTDLDQYENISYISARKVFTCPYVFERTERLVKSALISNPDFLFLNGRLTETNKGPLFNDMFFSMKRKFMVEYAEYSMKELDNNLSNHIGSEQNLYNFITNNNVDYEMLNFLGLIRNDWEINGQTLDVSNYHIC
tara:strand:- start:96 stop:797 length:702 start_codon:yes stop_codon:yes gene_type:complete